MPENNAPKPLKATALADFDYTADGVRPRPVAKGDKLDVAPHHYPGLIRAGMIEADPPAKHDEHLAAGNAAFVEPVQFRVARELAERDAAKGPRARAALPKEG